jgi:Fur family transcriptional regulator, peroxide stress response regulator
MDRIGDTGKKSRLEIGLAGIGLRPTRQRTVVYEVLEAHPDHPTAEIIFARSRAKMPTISLATVYNCLETLVDCGLVRAVHHDRLPTRYCSNAFEHAHFHDKGSDCVTDVALTAEALQYIRSLAPQDYAVESVELNFIGRRKSAGNHPTELTVNTDRQFTFNQDEPGNTQS